MPTRTRRTILTKNGNKTKVRSKNKMCGCKHIVNNPPHKSNNEGIINNRTMF